MNIQQGTPNDEVKATSKFIIPYWIFDIQKKPSLTKLTLRACYMQHDFQFKSWLGNGKCYKMRFRLTNNDLEVGSGVEPL